MAVMRTIPGFPEYAVTEDGRVWSKARMSPQGGRLKGKWRSLMKHVDGHIKIDLWKDGKQSTQLVHRLVLEAFVGPCPEGMQCCHNNGNPSDNRLENLRWDTPLANSHDSIKHGTWAHGIKNASAKLNDLEVLVITGLYKTGRFSYRQLGSMFEVSHHVVGQIVRRKTWKHVEVAV